MMNRSSAAVEPDDIVQETFLDFSRAALTEIDIPGAWLNTVARRKVASALKDNNVLTADGDMTKLIESNELRCRWTSMARAADLETQLAVRQALRELADLPSQQMVVSYLHWVCGWSQVEVAEFLGIARSTVAVHLHAIRVRHNYRNITPIGDVVGVQVGVVHGNAIYSRDMSEPTRYTTIWVWCAHWLGEPQRWLNLELHHSYQRQFRRQKEQLE